MAYMQEPGRAPLANKKVEALTNGVPLKQEKSRLQNALDKADKKSMDDGGPRKILGDFGGSGAGWRTSGRNRDIGSYVTTFVKEMVSPSKQPKPKPSQEETKGSGFGGRGY